MYHYIQAVIAFTVFSNTLFGLKVPILYSSPELSTHHLAGMGTGMGMGNDFFLNGYGYGYG